MDKNTYDKATRILKTIQEVELELKIWENELTHKRKLGYLQGWNNDHATALVSNMDTSLFDGFRRQVIDNLKLYLIELQTKLDDL